MLVQTRRAILACRFRVVLYLVVQFSLPTSLDWAALTPPESAARRKNSSGKNRSNK
jgi:hypothetical protein